MGRNGVAQSLGSLTALTSQEDLFVRLPQEKLAPFDSLCELFTS